MARPTIIQRWRGNTRVIELPAEEIRTTVRAPRRILEVTVNDSCDTDTGRRRGSFRRRDDDRTDCGNPHSMLGAFLGLLALLAFLAVLVFIGIPWMQHVVFSSSSSSSTTTVVVPKGNHNAGFWRNTMKQRSIVYAVVLHQYQKIQAKNPPASKLSKAWKKVRNAWNSVYTAWQNFYAQDNWQRYNGPPVNNWHLLIQWGHDQAVAQHLIPA